MKRASVFVLIVASACLVLTGDGHGGVSDTPTNELPMYGEVPREPWEQTADQKFVDEMLAQFGSREEAGEQCLKWGWQHFANGDYKTAMRRFNQAWLLTPNDPRVFHGYGSALGEMGQEAEFVKWNKKSAEMGWGNAQTNMGWAYLTGQGVGRNPVEAARWYQMAADQHHPTGLNMLGLLYDWGYGVAADSGHAQRLYGQADQGGFREPMGKMLRKAEFLRMSPQNAHMTFEDILHDIVAAQQASSRR